MVKLIALYRKPADREAFERTYFESHVPLVKKIPGLQRVEINRITGSPRGEPDFYLIAELYFHDEAAMERGLASPENMEAGKNLQSFARGLVSFMYAEELPD
jgi:uncharacterized protein (TIGR02118 family)